MPRVQWKGGSSAKVAFERHQALNEYYAAAAAGGRASYEAQLPRQGLGAAGSGAKVDTRSTFRHGIY